MVESTQGRLPQVSHPVYRYSITQETINPPIRGKNPGPPTTASIGPPVQLKTIIVLLALLCSPWGLSPNLHAAPQGPVSVGAPPEESPETSPTAQTESTPLAFSSPGRTLVTFLSAMSEEPTDFTTAIMCLKLPKGTYSKDITKQRALDLEEILVHLGYQNKENPGIPTDASFDKDTFSLLPAPTGSSPTIIQRSADLQGFTKNAAVLALDRSLNGRWLFNAETLTNENDEILRQADRQLMQKYPELLANARGTLSLRNWLLEITPPWLWGQFLFIAYLLFTIFGPIAT